MIIVPEALAAFTLVAAATASIFAVSTQGGGGNTSASSTEGEGNAPTWIGFDYFKRQVELGTISDVIISNDRMVGIPPSIPILQRRGKDLYNLGELEDNLKVRSVSNTFFKGTSDDIIKELKKINIEVGILYVRWNDRGFQSSGYNHKAINLEEKLLSMTTIDWKSWMDSLEKSNKRIVNLWVGCYDDDGFHAYHRDKGLRGEVRHILNIGCFGKQFWMMSEDESEETGLFMPHGGLVAMDEHASGMMSNIKHSAQGKSDGSWVIIFETATIDS